MKLSIKFLAIVAVFVSLNLTASAQRGDKSITPEQRAEKVTERMTKHLDLDTNQALKVKDLNLTLAAKMKAIKDANKGDRAAVKKEVKALRDDHKLALQDILTEEQWTKFAAHVEKKRQDRRTRKGDKKGK